MFKEIDDDDILCARLCREAVVKVGRQNTEKLDEIGQMMPEDILIS